jgi:hypothetical protein
MVLPIGFFLYLNLFILGLIVVKTVFFFKDRSRGWDLAVWFHFGYNSLHNTENRKRLRAKKFQNIMSAGILVFLILELVLFVLSKH